MSIVENALRGTYGRVWLEGEEIGILKSVSLKVIPTYEDVIIGHTVDRQAVSVKYEGSLSFEAVNSISTELCKKYLQNNAMRFTIECTLADPSAGGKEETYTINGVTFNEFPLANWQKGSLIQKSFDFRASDIVIVDLID